MTQAPLSPWAREEEAIKTHAGQGQSRRVSGAGPSTSVRCTGGDTVTLMTVGYVLGVTVDVVDVADDVVDVLVLAEAD